MNLSDFKAQYTKMIEFIQATANAKIILTTLSCIGENLSSDLNDKRTEYNNAIRSVAKSYGCLLADVADEFESVLEKSTQTNYLLNNFFDAVYFDKKASQKSDGPKTLSQKRSLILTIDGVHLNGNGANLYKIALENVINNDANNHGNLLIKKIVYKPGGDD